MNEIYTSKEIYNHSLSGSINILSRLGGKESPRIAVPSFCVTFITFRVLCTSGVPWATMGEYFTLIDKSLTTMVNMSTYNSPEPESRLTLCPHVTF